MESKKHPTIVVDEAHLLEQYNLLEPLRLLLNVAADRAPGESAWTLVLVGQEVAMAQVERYPALDERLAVKCMVGRMKPEETLSYIQHRLRLLKATPVKSFNPMPSKPSSAFPRPAAPHQSPLRLGAHDWLRRGNASRERRRHRQRPCRSCCAHVNILFQRGAINAEPRFVARIYTLANNSSTSCSFDNRKSPLRSGAMKTCTRLT